jgi:hypothetical protein
MHATPMKMNRGLLLASLTSVKAGLSPQETLEQSSCVVFGGGRVMTYNDEVACSAPTGLPEEYKGAVQSAPLVALLSRFPEEEVEVCVTRDEFLITGKRRTAGVRMDRTVLLPVDSVEAPEVWKPLPPEFTEAVGMVSQCVGRDKSQYHLTCVHLTPRWVEACDNLQLCRWRLRTPVGGNVLLGGEGVSQVVGLGVTEFGESKAWMHFRSPAGLVVSCRRYVEHDYPDLTPLLEVGGEPATFPRALAEEAGRAGGPAAENSDNKFVMIELRPGRLRIRGQGVVSWYESRMKVEYQGEPLRFFISPKVLGDLLKKHTDCVVAMGGDGNGKLKVTAGNYTWLGCLAKPEEQEVEMGPKGRKKTVAAEVDE